MLSIERIISCHRKFILCLRRPRSQRCSRMQFMLSRSNFNHEPENLATTS
jgi:hypothetical protein